MNINQSDIKQEQTNTHNPTSLYYFKIKPRLIFFPNPEPVGLLLKPSQAVLAPQRYMTAEWALNLKVQKH